jgi:hypothetical protein
MKLIWMQKPHIFKRRDGIWAITMRTGDCAIHPMKAMDRAMIFVRRFNPC